MKTFDLRESIIPFSLLQICNHFKRMQPGEMIEILTREAGTVEDIERIVPAPARETLLRVEQCENGPLYHLRLMKKTLKKPS